MSCEEAEVQNNSVYEAAVKIIQPCVNFITNFSFGHSVHPLEPAAPQYSDYLLLNNNKRLRIIHIKPSKIEYKLSNTENRIRISRNSLSEEYWFTRWNKPLKLSNCNCSFRRSQRFSALSNEHLPLSIYNPSASINDTHKSSLSHYNIPPTKITNINTFVDRLIEETFFEAFQECLVRKSIKKISHNEDGGLTNLGYIVNSGELDGVVLRQSLKAINSDQCGTLFEDRLKESIVKGARKKCTHENFQKIKPKPIVIMLHGIGSSADVWWHIINTLVYKGYEVVAPDMLGHGYSSIPDNANAYKFNNLLKYTLAVFDQYVGYDESKYSIVIGHSFGCSLATALCRYRSQQIIQLILISGGGPTPLAPPAPKDDRSFFNCMQTLVKPLLLCGVKRTAFYSTRGKYFNLCNHESAVPGYILDYIINGQHWPEGDAAFHRRILIPTLLVYGLQDTQVTLVQECEMERTIPRAFLELIPNAGHMCMLETPEHLNHMIMCFIDWWSR